MPTVVPVKFEYAARDLWFDPKESGVLEGDHVICQTERGLEIGLAVADPREISQEEFEYKTNKAELKDVVRVATDEDLSRAEELAAKGEAALPVFRKFAVQEELEMKPIGVEYLLMARRSCVTSRLMIAWTLGSLCVSFLHELHERIDMRQIGVREEAAVIGGYGHCGQELCCRRFGLSF